MIAFEGGGRSTHILMFQPIETDLELLEWRRDQLEREWERLEWRRDQLEREWELLAWVPERKWEQLERKQLERKRKQLEREWELLAWVPERKWEQLERKQLERKRKQLEREWELLEWVPERELRERKREQLERKREQLERRLEQLPRKWELLERNGKRWRVFDPEWEQWMWRWELRDRELDRESDRILKGLLEGEQDRIFKRLLGGGQDRIFKRSLGMGQKRILERLLGDLIQLPEMEKILIQSPEMKQEQEHAERLKWLEIVSSLVLDVGEPFLIGLLNRSFKTVQSVCPELVEGVNDSSPSYSAVFIMAAVLLCVYQYLIGLIDRGGSIAYSSGSLDFRDTYISVILFQGSYIWIKFRAVAQVKPIPGGAVRELRTFRQDRSLSVKHRPQFKPRQENGMCFEKLSLGQYESYTDAEVVYRAAASCYDYGKKYAGPLDFGDGGSFTIPISAMDEEAQSLSGMEKVEWVKGRVRTIYENFKREKDTRSQPLNSPGTSLVQPLLPDSEGNQFQRMDLHNLRVDDLQQLVLQQEFKISQQRLQISQQGLQISQHGLQISQHGLQISQLKRQVFELQKQQHLQQQQELQEPMHLQHPQQQQELQDPMQLQHPQQQQESQDPMQLQLQGHSLSQPQQEPLLCEDELVGFPDEFWNTLNTGQN